MHLCAASTNLTHHLIFGALEPVKTKPRPCRLLQRLQVPAATRTGRLMQQRGRVVPILILAGINCIHNRVPALLVGVALSVDPDMYLRDDVRLELSYEITPHDSLPTSSYVYVSTLMLSSAIVCCCCCCCCRFDSAKVLVRWRELHSAR